jgi:hypothetical protein
VLGRHALVGRPVSSVTSLNNLFPIFPHQAKAQNEILFVFPNPYIP